MIKSFRPLLSSLRHISYFANKSCKSYRSAISILSPQSINNFSFRSMSTSATDSSEIENFSTPTIEYAGNNEELKKQRLSKTEKKNLRYERTKAKGQEKQKRRKERKAEILSAMSPEDYQNRRDTIRLEKEAMIERMSESLKSGVNLCVEVSFENTSIKEKNALVKQIGMGYAYNKKTPIPVHLHITSLSSCSEVEQGLHSMGFENWYISRHQESVLNLFPREDLVIMSPDATEPLLDIDPTKVYVVGGIIDCTIKKDVTRSFALSNNIQMRRLPIPEYIPEGRLHVLNVDHMIKALTMFLETKDWHVSLLESMPKRRRQPHSNAKNALVDNGVLDSNNDEVVSDSDSSSTSNASSASSNASSAKRNNNSNHKKSISNKSTAISGIDGPQSKKTRPSSPSSSSSFSKSTSSSPPRSSSPISNTTSSPTTSPRVFRDFVEDRLQINKQSKKKNGGENVQWK